MSSPSRWLLLLAAGICGSPPALAARMGLKAMSEIRVEGSMKPGRPHNLRVLQGAEYRLLNEGDGAVEVETSVQAPPGSGLRPGYEPIPDPGWIRVLPARSRLPEGGGMARDIIVSVPDDPRWVGRRFQAVIASRTRGTGMISAAVRTHLLFAIAPSPGAKSRARETPAYEFGPSLLRTAGPPARGWLEAKDEEGRAPRASNLSSVKLKLRLERAPFGPVPLPAGYEELPEGASIRLSPATLRLPPDSAREWGLRLRVPEPGAGKRYALLIRARLTGQPVELEQHAVVLIDAGPEESR